MRIIIDADACPRGAFEAAAKLASAAGAELVTVANFNHEIVSEHHITVGGDPQEADLKIINLARAGNIVVTQDIGLAAMVLAGADGIIRKMDPVALGYQSQDAKEELTFPLNLNAVLDGVEKDKEYLAPAFPEKLIELWTKAKRAEAEYIYNAPTPQEYELYF